MMILIDHIGENSQRVLKLNNQYENHPYFEEFRKQCSVMFTYATYVLKGETDVKFSLINQMRAWNYLQKPSDTPENIENIRQTHKIIMNDVLTDLGGWGLGLGGGVYRRSPAFAGYHILAPAGHIEGYMKDAIFRFHEHETKKVDPIMATTNLFENTINIHLFGEGNERIFLGPCFDTDEMLSISCSVEPIP